MLKLDSEKKNPPFDQLQLNATQNQKSKTVCIEQTTWFKKSKISNP